MSRVKYIWTEEYVGKRFGPEIPEEGDRTKPFSESIWSQVEILPWERIKEIQLEKFQYLVKFAYENSPFYRKKWEESGIKPSDVKTLEDVAKLPVLTKEDFQRDQMENPPYGTAVTSPANTQAQYYQTSGTTGRPRLWSDIKQDLENAIEATIRAYYAQGIRPGWRAFWAFGFPPFMGFWHMFYASQAMGCQNVPKGPVPTVAWLKLIQNLAGNAPSFLCCTPTYGIRQLEVAREAGINPKDLKINTIIVAGEPGYNVPATNKMLSEGWGAKIHDQAGSTEHGGPVLFSCDFLASQGKGDEHITADYWLLEVLDPKTMEPVEPDSSGYKKGIACVTALSRFGFPAIRLLLGDYVEIMEGERCGCGRNLPIARGGLIARADDMIIVKGVNIYPSLIENTVRSIAELNPEYRLQKTLTGATVIVEASESVSELEYENIAKKLQQAIKEKTTVRLDVKVEKPGTLPREEAKTKRVI